jgi:hypothetical protein
MLFFTLVITFITFLFKDNNRLILKAFFIITFISLSYNYNIDIKLFIRPRIYNILYINIGLICF